MGVRGLAKLLSAMAPKGVQQKPIDAFVGKVIAIDASLALYQFMIAIKDSEGMSNLLNDSGNTTSHITGFLSRVTKLLELGIKPVYVFDGEPLYLKTGELAKRAERREKAEAELQEATIAGDKEGMKKFMNRTIKVTKQHNMDVKELLRYMGVPVLDAPTEAEAQCATLAASGLAYGTATEDSDALTFGSPVLIKHLNFSDQKNGQPILVYNLNVILEELSLTMSQFVDLCILCGCDYVDRIKGVGPLTSLKLIKKYGDIEKVVNHLSSTNNAFPEPFNYQEAKQFFLSPKVLKEKELPKLTWGNLQEDLLRKFLVEKHSFNAARVENFITRIRNSKNKASQTTLESFFKPALRTSSVTNNNKKLIKPEKSKALKMAENSHKKVKRRGQKKKTDS